MQEELLAQNRCKQFDREYMALWHYEERSHERNISNMQVYCLKVLRGVESGQGMDPCHKRYQRAALWRFGSKCRHYGW